MPLMKKDPEPREVTFELNQFDQPLEVTGADAWIRDIVAMAFMENGTYSDDPDLGCHISKELFTDIDTAVGEVKSRMDTMVAKYLDDIPIDDLTVAAYYWDEKSTYVLVLSVTFSIEEGHTTYAAYVSIIDHELSYIISQL